MICLSTFSLQFLLWFYCLPLVTNKRGYRSRVELWEPEDGTPREKWIDCKGLPCDQWIARQKKLFELKALEMPPEEEEYYDYIQQAVKHPEDMTDETIMTMDYDECEWPNIEEIEDNINSEKKQLGKARVREKRRFHEYITTKELKWDIPVHYKIDGNYKSREVDTIKRAIRHIEANTCIRFKQLQLKEELPDDQAYVIFIREYDRCHSWVGRQKNMTVQPISVQQECLDILGEVVHEILHTLGMWHEEQRTDRDKYVKINYQNLKNSRSQFTKKIDTQNFHIPYDYGSVMHYSAKALSKNFQYVIEPRQVEDNLYKHNMGQRTGLSFYDHFLLNRAYCPNSCDGRPLPQTCQHGGYQDPNYCTRCKCLPAYGGIYCEKLHSSNGLCGGEIQVTNSHTISTPGWPWTPYSNKLSCTWRFGGPSNSRLSFEFQGLFSLLMADGATCYHWVEVVYNNMDAPGPRFCGFYRPKARLVSAGNQMIVMLRTNFTTSVLTERMGFKAKISLVRDEL